MKRRREYSNPGPLPKKRRYDSFQHPYYQQPNYQQPKQSPPMILTHPQRVNTNYYSVSIPPPETYNYINEINMLKSKLYALDYKLNHTINSFNEKIEHITNNTSVFLCDCEKIWQIKERINKSKCTICLNIKEKLFNTPHLQIGFKCKCCNYRWYSLSINGTTSTCNKCRGTTFATNKYLRILKNLKDFKKRYLTCLKRFNENPHDKMSIFCLDEAKSQVRSCLKKLEC